MNLNEKNNNKDISDNINREIGIIIFINIRFSRTQKTFNINTCEMEFNEKE